MKTNEFKYAVEALDGGYQVFKKPLCTDVIFKGNVVSTIGEVVREKFSFQNTNTKIELPHFNSLIHALIIPYALTPLRDRIEPLYTLPIGDGQYLWRQKDELTITSIPIRWDQQSIDNMANDFKLPIDINELKERVN